MRDTPSEFASLLSSLKKKKKSPKIIKVSCGIGDTDGFPALDPTSDAYSVPEDLKWGFRITGGSEFHMPITVFQVSDDGLAYNGGIRLGDIITEINGVDTKDLTLAQAQAVIDEAYDKLHLIARKMDEESTERREKTENEDEENEENEQKPIEEKSVMLRRRLPPKIPDPPKEFRPTPLLGTKVWHPIMCELPKIDPNEIRPGEEPPHLRIMRNIKRFFNETKDNPELQKKHLEEMLMVLPK